MKTLSVETTCQHLNVDSFLPSCLWYNMLFLHTAAAACCSFREPHRRKHKTYQFRDRSS